MPNAIRPADPLVTHLLELMAPVAARVGAITARRMFGGHGLFHDGLMFALVLRGTCYLKADAHSQARFDAQGSEPFRYLRAGREAALHSYLSLPGNCLESAEAMTPWALGAIEAALRAANAPAKARKRAGGVGERAKAGRA